MAYTHLSRTLRLIILFVVLGVWSLGIFGLALFLQPTLMPEGINPPTVTINGVDGNKIDLAYGEQPLLAIESFFANTKQEFIEKRIDFIEADLATMRLRVYKSGVQELDIPILTKGKEGSWWETPAGLYSIQSKEENHFSSFGHVYQPWSMAFQGNFFIHGWPYHPDGTAVSSTFSGGCIRLSDEDAKKVYDLASKGMPVLVHEQDFTNDSYSYGRVKPTLTAKSYLVADIESGTVLSVGGGDEVRSIASLTKLVTALVAAEYINLDKNIDITERMLATTSIPRLEAGTSTSAYGLFFPLLRESSNEAAEALGQSIGRARFIELMNTKAKAIGMRQTVFTDVSGAESGNVSTANDLFHLARYLYNNRSFILNISSGKRVVSAYNEPVFEDLQNFNEISGIGGLVGGKVGKSSSASETGLYLYRVKVGEEDRVLAVIVLGSDNREGDIHKLVSFIENQYSVVFQ